MSSKSVGALSERTIDAFTPFPSSYPRSRNLCPEAVVDFVGKPPIFIHYACLIAPLCDYGSAF